jgi:hypothetical protein
MNLQQHYDLIGQILKERPELAELQLQTVAEGSAGTVFGKPNRLELSSGTSLYLCCKNSPSYKEDEILWQLP